MNNATHHNESVPIVYVNSMRFVDDATTMTLNSTIPFSMAVSLPIRALPGL